MDPSARLDSILAHYGVKGMHWGVRKDRGGVSTGRKASSKESPSEEHTKTKEIVKKGKSSGKKSLSNKELQDAINRINLENQYSKLAPSKSAQIKKGHNVIKGIIATGATINAAIAFANSPAGKAIKNSLSK